MMILSIVNIFNPWIEAEEEGEKEKAEEEEDKLKRSTPEKTLFRKIFVFKKEVKYFSKSNNLH